MTVTCKAVVIEDSVVERLARSIHAHYLTEQRRDGVERDDRPAMVAWSELDEDMKDANRAQARDINKKLERIGYTVGPPTRSAVTFVFSDAELDVLARDEHIRWTEERLAAGWTSGRTRRRVQAPSEPRRVGQSLRVGERQGPRRHPQHSPGLAEAGLQIVRR